MEKTKVTYMDTDAQRLEGKTIYGNGFLLSENATRDAEAAARETETAVREAEVRRAEAVLREDEAANAWGTEYVWELSERERGIVANLGKNEEE